jgi:hypothetical protein
MGDLFGPVGPEGNFHHNAVLTHHEDDGTLGAGYVAAGDALVEHWVEHGPNDLLFMPIITNYRHGIELLLKDAIRTAARCLRRGGITDPELRDPELSKWLARGVRHKLQPLAERLDQLLGQLREETLPPNIHKTLIRVHELDPTGETFRYATSWSKEDNGSCLRRGLTPHTWMSLPWELSSTASRTSSKAALGRSWTSTGSISPSTRTSGFSPGRDAPRGLSPLLVQSPKRLIDRPPSYVSRASLTGLTVTLHL